MSQGSLILTADRVRLKLKNETINTRSHRTQNIPRNPQQLGHRDHISTACDEARPTRLSILASFYRFRVYGNRPRTALAMNENREGRTCTDRRTNRLTKPWNHGHAHPGMKRLFRLICKKQSRSLQSLRLPSSLVER